MVSISLCMIVKNEEKTLSRCLNSVKNIVDEIILVDTGSNDQTIEIAKKFGAKIYHFQWIDDFSAARNHAFSHAHMDYIFTLDADDVLSKADSEKLEQLKKSISPTIDAVTMKCLAGFDESGNVLVSLRQVRMVKRENQFKWQGAVHEYLEVHGNMLHSEIAITHKREHSNSDRNLRIYEQRQKNGALFSPRDLYYFANELYDHQQYERAIQNYQKFLQSGKCWIEDVIQAHGRIAECYAALGKMDNAIHSALYELKFGPPRAESCCRLGFFFLQLSRPEIAVHWFQFATQLPAIDTGGITNHACSSWIPHLQLSVCYSHLGDYQKALEHIEMAKTFNPEHDLILKNETILKNFIKK
ncbi:glycosyltransferase [Bacillus salipaludis]|uniref:Glycosyltransferase n=1 Tax=Bacillus salipaludis TaxID=2547811 RepID=A0A4V3AU47_9BACI|nr:glycosyltransferase [Bacillus salipaludis]MDQ6597515.1 glycosyltransferase [Bacillus salipaludis]TDK63063.1 glycosyltransferase [Bacillus salipaludis]